MINYGSCIEISLSAEILSATGALVLSIAPKQFIESGIYRIDTSTFEGGLYYLKYTDLSGVVKTKSFVVIH